MILTACLSFVSWACLGSKFEVSGACLGGCQGDNGLSDKVPRLVWNAARVPGTCPGTCLGGCQGARCLSGGLSGRQGVCLGGFKGSTSQSARLSGRQGWSGRLPRRQEACLWGCQGARGLVWAIVSTVAWFSMHFAVGSQSFRNFRSRFSQSGHCNLSI